jgi:hypothetical protein
MALTGRVLPNRESRHRPLLTEVAACPAVSRRLRGTWGAGDRHESYATVVVAAVVHDSD